jgi:hypothetical protein
MPDQVSVYGNPNKTSSWVRPQRDYVPALQHCTEGHHNYKFLNVKSNDMWDGWRVSRGRVQYKAEIQLMAKRYLDGFDVLYIQWIGKITVIRGCSLDGLNNDLVRDAWILHNNKSLWLTFPIPDVWISVSGKTVVYAGDFQSTCRLNPSHSIRCRLNSWLRISKLLLILCVMAQIMHL